MEKNGASEGGNNNNKDNARSIRLGLRPNINQFLILVLVNAFVGAMIGLEQTVVPLIGKERIATILIMVGLFGGLIGGPIASLADYHAPPQKRLWLFIVPEFIGFACVGLMVYYGRSRKK